MRPPRRPLPLRAAAALALAALVAVSSCACDAPGEPDPTPAASSPGPAAPITVAARASAESLSPSEVADPSAEAVVSLLFRGLVRDDEKGKSVLAVAQSIDTDDDLVFKVTLAPGWSFSNGERVTASSFVRAWSAGARAAARQGRASAYSPILGYRPDRTATSPDTLLPGLVVLDDTTFTITLTEPQPGFVARLSGPEFAPLPSVAFTDPAGFARAPIGNGPYRLDGPWEPTGTTRLVPSPAYRGSDPPRNAGVTFRVYGTPAQAYADLAAGRVDVIDGIPQAALAGYRAELGARAVDQPVGQAQSLVFPLQRPEWAGTPGLAARRAISRAIDRTAITATTLRGTAAPATDLAAPVVEGYSPDACGADCGHDIDSAKRQWALAGGRLRSLRIAYAQDTDDAAVVAALCTSISQAVPVTCEPRPYATATALRQAVEAGSEHAPYLQTWRMRRPTLAGFLTPRFLPDAPQNTGGYRNEAVTTRLATAATAPQGAQAAGFLEAEKAILDDLPVVPLWSRNAVGGWSPTVTDVRTNVFGAQVYGEITRPRP